MKRKTVIVIGFLLFILLLNFFSFKNHLKNIFFLLFQPINKFFINISFSLSALKDRIKTNEELSKENSFLKEQIKILEEKLVRLDELEKENQFLRESINLTKKIKHPKVVMAEVIGVFPFDDKILINKGKKDDIQKGMMVVLDNNSIVGQIDGVFDDFAEVSLISNKSFSLSAKIFNKEIFGLVRGGGSGHVYLDRILKEEGELEKDDIVVSWQTEKVPSGFLIGKVKGENISKEKTEVEPYFSLLKIRWVLVLKEFER